MADEKISSPQRLPTRMASVCERCGERVYFAFRSSRRIADPRFRAVYLQCPKCGHTATQLQEVVEPSEAPPGRRARRFKYVP